MSLASYFVQGASYMAKIYKKLPIRPMNSLLGKLYLKVLDAHPEASIVHKDIDGIRFELDLREVIDNEMFYYGSREPETTRTLELLCKPGDILLDIGANVGSHTLPMARLAGNSGRVYAFEPVPWAMAKLKRNIELNGYRNIVTEQLALSDVDLGSVNMEFRASFRIGASKGVDGLGQIDQGWWQECDHVSTRMQTLDDYVASHGLNRVDLIKLDVDGFEGKVVRGAIATLMRFKPIIIMELAPAWLEMRGDSCLKIAHQLQDFGYRCFAEVSFDEHQAIDDLIKGIPPGNGVNVVFAIEKPLKHKTDAQNGA